MHHPTHLIVSRFIWCHRVNKYIQTKKKEMWHCAFICNSALASCLHENRIVTRIQIIPLKERNCLSPNYSDRLPVWVKTTTWNGTDSVEQNTRGSMSTGYSNMSGQLNIEKMPHKTSTNASIPYLWTRNIPTV